MFILLFLQENTNRRLLYIYCRFVFIMYCMYVCVYLPSKKEFNQDKLPLISPGAFTPSVLESPVCWTGENNTI